MSSETTTVFICYPNAEDSAYFKNILEKSGQPLQAIPVPDFNTLYGYLPTVTDKAIILADIIWEGQNYSDILLSISLSYPRIGILIVSQADVHSYLPPYYPLPSVQGFHNTDFILSHLLDLTEDLRNTQIGAYHVIDYAGQKHLSRCYYAHHPEIRRDVHLVILNNTATQEQGQTFLGICSAQAKNIHPSVYAIYEESTLGSRPFYTQEPNSADTLLQLTYEQATFDSRLLARLIHTTSTALQSLYTNQIPHYIVRSSDITLSKEGVIKMQNLAIPSDQPMPNEQEEVVALGNILQPFVNNVEEIDPRIQNLVAQMQTGEAPLQQVVSESHTVDLALAPVKYVPQRQESIEAAAQVEKARKNFWIYFGVLAIGFAIFSVIVLIKLFESVLDQPGTDFKKQCKVPSGKVVYKIKGEQKVFPVKEFYIDEYEVTIGQYEKFLEAVKDIKPDQLLPEDFPFEKRSFVPKEWKEIMYSVKKKRPYQGETLTRDTPIFNVDYGDALAYAKWAGKRLPTEIEWIRAASGNKQYKLPWGNKADKKRANTAIDRNQRGNVKPGGVDGYRGPAPVDALKKDESDFEVRGMAGNISEWVIASPELGSSATKDQARFKGSNFGYPPASNHHRFPPIFKNSKEPWLGFRCASDKLISKEQ